MPVSVLGELARGTFRGQKFATKVEIILCHDLRLPVIDASSARIAGVRECHGGGCLGRPTACGRPDSHHYATAVHVSWKKGVHMLCI